MAQRVLTIDDESAIRRSFVLFLEDYDYEVLEAEDGQQGIELIEGEKPDLVLVDLRMPKLDGLSVLDYVETNYPEMPVIAISGTGNINDVIDALHLGAWDYILKPVEDLNILLYAVRRALEKQRLRRENRKYREELEWEVERKTAELRAVNRRLLNINEDLKENQARLEQSVREKEVLLREVHHRVKNNMQIIMSLMSLQKPVYRDQFDRLLVEKSINRIQAMALAHEQLYQTNDLSRLDLSSYLSGVIGEIASGNIQVGTDIEVTTKVDPLLLGLELAIPLGIIIYELVNNAIEHGFPEGQRGRIEVRGVVQNDTCGIEVHDDGVGLPEGFDAQRNENLGLLLVQMLSSQLGAKLEFHKDSGTLVRLIFPCPR